MLCNRIKVALRVPLAAMFLLLIPRAISCDDASYEKCIDTGLLGHIRKCACLPKIKPIVIPPPRFNPPSFTLPTCGGFVCDGIVRMVDEAKAQAFGHALAVWMQESRNNAIGSAQPIPPEIRQPLRGYLIDDDAMNRVRFKVDDNGVVNLANDTFHFGAMFTGIDANAVTLVDLVIFRTADGANNPALWAHELTHVMQYRNWGVDNFGVRYARDANAVERPAYAAGDNYWTWRSQAGLVQQQVGTRRLQPSEQLAMRPLTNIQTQTTDLATTGNQSGQRTAVVEHQGAYLEWDGLRWFAVTSGDDLSFDEAVEVCTRHGMTLPAVEDLQTLRELDTGLARFCVQGEKCSVAGVLDFRGDAVWTDGPTKSSDRATAMFWETGGTIRPVKGITIGTLCIKHP